MPAPPSGRGLTCTVYWGLINLSGRHMVGCMHAASWMGMRRSDCVVFGRQCFFRVKHRTGSDIAMVLGVGSRPSLCAIDRVFRPVSSCRSDTPAWLLLVFSTTVRKGLGRRARAFRLEEDGVSGRRGGGGGCGSPFPRCARPVRGVVAGGFCQVPTLGILDRYLISVAQKFSLSSTWVAFTDKIKLRSAR